MKKLKVSTILVAVAGLVASIFAYKGIRKGIEAWKGIEVQDDPETLDDRINEPAENIGTCGDSECCCDCAETAG